MEILALILFGICVYIFIRINKKDEKDEKTFTTETADDSNCQDFSPYLKSRLKEEPEDEEEEEINYNDFLEY